MPKPVPQHRGPRRRGGLRDRRSAAHHRRIRAPGAAVRRRAGRAAVGHGVSEAPRGLLYHRYEIGDDGLIRAATIVPPTAQNQAAIEHEMAELVAANLSLDDATLTSLCEQAIRNYDPCISCSAHFLTLDGRTSMSRLVIGIGNSFRRDDGVGTRGGRRDCQAWTSRRSGGDRHRRTRRDPGRVERRPFRGRRGCGAGRRCDAWPDPPLDAGRRRRIRPR